MACEDCGAAVTASFCPVCGQPREHRATLFGMIEQLLHGITHVDSKLWRTLPLLALHPGRLTRAFLDGKRTRYLSPGTLFLASAFFMFLAFNVVGVKPMVAACHAPSAEIALDRFETRVQSGLQDTARRSGPVARLFTTGIAMGVTHVGDRLPHSMRLTLGKAANNPDYVMLQLKQKAYKFGFLLVPLSLPALWLLFGRLPGVQPYDLAVFSLHSIAFMSVLLTVTILVGASDRVPWQAAALMLLVIPPLHMYRHVREGFALGSFSALWRTALLVGAAILTLAGFLLLVLALGLQA